MSDSPAVRAVLFDFNGTLCDDERLVFGIFEDLFAERLDLRFEAADYFGRLAGRSDREIVETVVGEHPRHDADDAGLVAALLAERGRRYRDRVTDDSPVLPSTLALVRALAETGMPLAIVTGAQREDVDQVLGGAAIADCFRSVVSVEDVVEGKPHPEGFLRAAGLLGVPAGQAVVLEDSVAGVRAAHAAGMRCIALTGTHDRATLEHEGVVVVDALAPDLLTSLS